MPLWSNGQTGGYGGQLIDEVLTEVRLIEGSLLIDLFCVYNSSF